MSLLMRNRKAGLLLKSHNATRISNITQASRSHHPKNLTNHSFLRHPTQHPQQFPIHQYSSLTRSTRYSSIENRLNHKALQQFQQCLHVERTKQVNSSTETFLEWILKQVKVPKGKNRYECGF